MGALMSKRSQHVMEKKWTKMVDGISDVKDWVETSRDDAMDIHKRFLFTKRAVLDHNKRLQTALNKMDTEYKEVMGECGTFEKIQRYCTLKDICHDVCTVYDEVIAFSGPMPERDAKMNDFEYTLEIVVCFERARAKRQMKEKSLMKMSDWLNKGKGLLDNASSMQQRTRERVQYDSMSTMEIIQENKSNQDEILEYVVFAEVLYKLVNKVNIDFIKSKELPPPQRYGVLKKIIETAIHSDEYRRVVYENVYV